MAENWADLLPVLLELCSRRLLLEDRFAFRSVCSTWRAAAFEERFDLPWLMLADDKRAETEFAEFYSLFSLQTHRLLLPEVKGKRCFSSRGWILTIGKDFKIHMLNPLSRAVGRRCRSGDITDIIKLPSMDKLPEWDPELHESERTYSDFIEKFVLSASPASSPIYTVMVLYLPFGQLGFWKPGNREWKKLTQPGYPVLDVIHYKGQFLAVNCSGDILACDVDGPDPTARFILKRPPAYHKIGFLQLYLVESAGRLLLVSRVGRRGKDGDDEDGEDGGEEDGEDGGEYRTTNLLLASNDLDLLLRLSRLRRRGGDDLDLLPVPRLRRRGEDGDDEDGEDGGEDCKTEDDNKCKTEDDGYCRTHGFQVFAVDLEAKEWTELQSLGKASLFVGFSSSFSVQVDENQHAIKPNCIYFTDDCSLVYRHTKDGGGKDMGIYHMEDGRIESFYDGKSYHHFSPPLWIEPSF